MDQMIVRLQGANIQQGAQIILEQVNLRIAPGEFTYLIGKTGSGKTSLLKTLYGALPLQTGEGTVAGFKLKKLNRKSLALLRREMGIVFQDFNLLSDRSVYDNLAFVLRATGQSNKKQVNQRIQEVLEQVGLPEKIQVMPHQLSGGEQQRIVIARALLNNPKIIIADEPTGNLDPETSDDILLLLRKVSKAHQAAVLFATHDYRILEHFPARIIRCMNQRIFDDEEIELL
ncbi:MAG TPA: ATP-binding cassette domain-containing protein [Saprospiraceae bacterium]|nr:ATP-binding cassette domain-containing protein [Saprospiraceae bacterium]